MTYTYDDNGNLIEKQNAEEQIVYQYDYENHLTRVETTRYGATIVVEYDYDAYGNRVRKTIDGTVVITYLVDTNRDYAQVVEERDSSGNLLVRYVYGHDLISQTRDSVTSYYQYDGLGSTRALTSSAGIVTDTYTYDAFGTLTAKTGSTPNDYLFTGEQFDPELGFYYLRARYMDPNVGRFVTMDSFAGRNSDPVTLHKYLYANANPVNYVDPSGYEGFMNWLGSSNILGNLMQISIQVAKRALPNMILGGIANAFIRGIDASLGGEDVGGAMIDGFLGGMTFGFLATFSALRPIIIYMGLKSSLDGVYESWKAGKIAQMVFRALILYQQLKYLTERGADWDSQACFVADTLVYTTQGYKPIQDIDIGDMVYSTDVGADERELVQSRVTEIYQRETETVIDLTVRDSEGNESVITGTPEHPFWVPAANDFIPMGQLVAEQQLRTADGSLAVVVARKTYHGHFTVYNIEVERNHTYYVASPDGLQGVLVHNIDCNGNDNIVTNLDDRTTAENRQVFDSLAAGQGMSGVYDHSTGLFLLIRSTNAASIPEGWVAQAGGHEDVFGELTNGNGDLTKLPGRFSGFAISRESGAVRFRWNSGRINDVSHGSRSVPKSLRPGIIAAVKKAVVGD